MTINKHGIWLIWSEKLFICSRKAKILFQGCCMGHGKSVEDKVTLLEYPAQFSASKMAGGMATKSLDSGAR